jgi:colicin import membrane protein
MTTPSPFIKRLKIAATKAAARAAAAKTQVRAAKAHLKQARKLFKTEKKAAKQARQKVDAAASATTRARRPAAALKLKPAVRKASAPKPVRPVRKSRKAALKTTSKGLPKKIKPRRAAKARAPAPGMRSAAEVAKTVIERLHAPPPILPPEPVIPTEPSLRSEDATASVPGKS